MNKQLPFWCTTLYSSEAFYYKPFSYFIRKFSLQTLNIEELINDERKFMGSNTEEKIEKSLAKRLRVTENRLDQVTVG